MSFKVSCPLDKLWDEPIFQDNVSLFDPVMVCKALLFDFAQFGASLNAAAKDMPFEVLVCVDHCSPLPAQYMTGSNKQVLSATHVFPAGAWDARLRQEDATQTKISDKLSAVERSVKPMEISKVFSGRV